MIRQSEHPVRPGEIVAGDRGERLEALRAHLAEGAEQAVGNDFIEDFDIEDVIERAKARV
jgi:hypothetical protein